MAQRSRGRKFTAAHGVPLALAVVSILLVSLSNGAFFELPNRISSTVTGAIEVAFSTIGNAVSRTVFSIRELGDLRNQYSTLVDKLAGYQNLERDYTALRAENERLKEVLDFKSSVTTLKTSAQIIAKEPGNIYSSYVLDKGENSGIAKNMAVGAFQNGTEALAGRIISTTSSASIVLPLYDRRFFVSARFSRSRVEGLVSGQGNQDDPLVMQYVPKLAAADIQIGDLVVTSGLDSIFPGELAIGRVSKVDLPDYGSSALVYLDPSLNFSKLEYVFVMEKTDPSQQAGGEEAGK